MSAQSKAIKNKQQKNPLLQPVSGRTTFVEINTIKLMSETSPVIAFVS